MKKIFSNSQSVKLFGFTAKNGVPVIYRLRIMPWTLAYLLIRSRIEKEKQQEIVPEASLIWMWPKHGISKRDAIKYAKNCNADWTYNSVIKAINQNASAIRGQYKLDARCLKNIAKSQSNIDLLTFASAVNPGQDPDVRRLIMRRKRPQRAVNSGKQCWAVVSVSPKGLISISGVYSKASEAEEVKRVVKSAAMRGTRIFIERTVTEAY